ncbi:PGC-1 and ERR-induced regulator in muscle protein 1 isoform X2 [Rhineura floridana]|uniref:PGC-1 and ERR-induced regulator in muscle protein 1 isoform X2 n=1 Tax=Rhineura floridana TaxID=261503 RepID=UPI002AC82D4C|nr:PGC-1 and ERR-induced regulator in muscle protein 1 isoform X2 [Rhineura floridana]
MENFEYSIQLNDRDWAEFYLASEECSLIQPALATADEQLLSDLEEGETEQSGLLRVRVGPIPVNDSASCLPRGAPDGHLLAKEFWSGSEDETDLGSVSRFLCNNNNVGRGFSRSSRTQESQLSHATLKPMRSHCRLPGSAAEREAVSTAKEGETERGDQPINPECSLPVVVATAIQEQDLQEQSQRQERLERPACAERTNSDATERMDSSVGENRNRPLCLKLQPPKDDTPQAASAGVKSMESPAVCEDPESPKPRDLAAYPSSARLPSSVSAEIRGAAHPEKGTKHPQIVLKAQAVTPFQENSPKSQGRLVQIMRVSAPSHLPSESHHGESMPGKVSREKEGSASFKDERGTTHSEDLKEGGLIRQVRASLSDNRMRQFPKGLEENRGPRPTQATDSRWDGILGKGRGTLASPGRAEMGKSGETCHHLGRAVPLGEEPRTLLQGDQRSDFLGGLMPDYLTEEDSPESDVTAMTWPEVYDYFFCDDSQKKGENMCQEIGKEEPDTGQQPPEMDGPEMYEYFFHEMDEAQVRNKDIAQETLFSSGHLSAPPDGLEDPDLDKDKNAMQISIPEAYEHFFAHSAKDKRNWRAVFLSMPASEARKVARALKSLVSRPARLFRSRPTTHGALLRRGSQGTLVLLSPGLLDENQPRPEDLRMAMMQPGPSSQSSRNGTCAWASWRSLRGP